MLGLVGIVTAVLAVIILLIGDEILFKESIVAKNWEIIHDENADKTDKIRALQYLAQQEESLADVNLSGGKTSLQGLDLSPVTLNTKENTRHIKIRADLKNANFMQADLSDVNFSGADISGAIFYATNLRNARLHNVNLSKANLSEANLYNTNLSGADLSKTNLSKAQLFGTDLTAVDLSGANFSDAELVAVNFTSANLSNVVFNEGTVIEYAWIWRTTDKQHPLSYLPTGIPKNWDTVLKPAYTCPQNYKWFDASISKDQIKRKMEKFCEPYVHWEAPPVNQETPTDRVTPSATLEIRSVPLHNP